jgi:phosphate transport system substrate-binding protein
VIDKVWGKILLCVIIVVALSFIGFVVMVITALSGGVKFYTPLVITITSMLIIFTVLGIFNFAKPKILTRILVSFLIICALAVTGYEINKAYIASLATVNEQGVNLNEYKPFTENTKAVQLDELSTLKMEEDLPRLDGATALYPLYSAFAQATYPEKEYNISNSEVMCNTTVGAYENLINGEVDIIFAARPSKQQLMEAKMKGVELKLTPIGREAFVFFVNSKNKVNELSTNQIQDIYSGKITNWAELGGSDDKIRAFQRPENSGSQTMLQKLMEGKTLMIPPNEDVVSGMGGIIEQTASYRNYKNAIGYSFLFFATEMIQDGQIRLLKVDGINPEKSTIKSGEYPLATEFYAVTAGSENPNIDLLIEWILSSQGQSLVERTGYTVINS